MPGENATTVQVGKKELNTQSFCTFFFLTFVHSAISVVASLRWTLREENRHKGLCYAEDLPHREILDCSKHYIDPFVSIWSDWDPLKTTARALWDYKVCCIFCSDPFLMFCVFVSLFQDMFHHKRPSEEDKWQFVTMLSEGTQIEPFSLLEEAAEPKPKRQKKETQRKKK